MVRIVLVLTRAVIRCVVVAHGRRMLRQVLLARGIIVAVAVVEGARYRRYCLHRMVVWCRRKRSIGAILCVVVRKRRVVVVGRHGAAQSTLRAEKAGQTVAETPIAEYVPRSSEIAEAVLSPRAG
jgi:hypothetical protein